MAARKTVVPVRMTDDDIVRIDWMREDFRVRGCEDEVTRSDIIRAALHFLYATQRAVRESRGA